MSPEEYGVLVLSLEDVTGGHAVDGSLTLDLEAVAEAYLVKRRAEIESRREVERREYEAAVRAHQERCRASEQEHEAQTKAIEIGLAPMQSS